MKTESFSMTAAYISMAGVVFTAIVNKGNNTLFYVFLFSLLFFLLVYSYLKQRKYNIKNPVNLKEHHFFSKMNYWKKVYIPNLEMCIQNPKKEKLIKSFLIELVESFSNGMRENLCEHTKYCICNQFESRLYDIAEKFEYKIIKQGCPEIFVTKFKRWSEPSLKFLIDSVSKICQIDCIDCNRKMSMILDLCAGAFSLNLVYALKALKDLNGELDAALK